MRQVCVACASYQAKNLPLLHSISGSHADRAALHVTEIAVLTAAMVERHLIAGIGRLVGYGFVQLGFDYAMNWLIGHIVARVDYGCIGGGYDPPPPRINVGIRGAAIPRDFPMRTRSQNVICKVLAAPITVRLIEVVAESDEELAPDREYELCLLLIAQ